MNTGHPEIQYSSVTLMFSGSADAGDMIEVAGRLARAAGARLQGLLLEDQTLFDLAQLPFSASIAPGPLFATEPLTAQGLELAFAKQERILRNLMAETAKRREIDWTLDRHRGVISDLVFSAREDELLLVCDDVATNEAESAFVSVGDRRDRLGGFGILKPQALKKTGPVMAIMGCSPSAKQTLRLVQRLAAGLGRPYELLLLPGNEDEATELEDWVKSSPAEPSLGRTNLMSEFSEAALKAEISQTRPSLIIGDLCGWPFDDAETGARIIRSCRCPVVLLRCSRS